MTPTFKSIVHVAEQLQILYIIQLFALKLSEVSKIFETINSLLVWAELEKSEQKQNLYVNRLATTVTEVAHRLSQVHPGRIQMD